MTKMPQVLKHILTCGQGDHSLCKEMSYVCKQFKAEFPDTKQLPYGKKLDLSTSDLQKIELKLEYYFVKDLNKLKGAKNTNKVESKHHRASTYCPKMSTHSRNVEGLCASALHSDTFSTGASATKIAHAIGITTSPTGPFQQVMDLKDKKSEYDLLRQRQKTFKTARVQRFNRRVQRKAREGAPPTTAAIDNDHEYVL